MATKTAIEDRVTRSEELLNEKGPDAWWEKVNLDELDVYNYSKCVLGQVFGAYGKGLRALGIDHEHEDQMAEYAFDSSDYQDFEQMNLEWKKRIRRLQTTK